MTVLVEGALELVPCGRGDNGGRLCMLSAAVRRGGGLDIGELHCAKMGADMTMEFFKQLGS